MTLSSEAKAKKMLICDWTCIICYLMPINTVINTHSVGHFYERLT